MAELIQILRDMADMLDGPQNAGNLVTPAIIHRFRDAADTIESLETENAVLRAQQEQPNEPLTLDELRQMESGQWVWIEVFQLLDYQCKVSAYHQKQCDYTDGKMFCCGYPGTTFGFDYADYGKTWLAYRRKPEQEEL